MKNSKYWFDIEGKWVADSEAMVAHLLEENILFLNSRKYALYDNSGVSSKETMLLFLNCNDVFAWACADAEEVALDELPELFQMYEANPKFGPIQWVCKKRNEKPQLPIIKYLKENDGWNDMMETLPPNRYDAPWLKGSSNN